MNILDHADLSTDQLEDAVYVSLTIEGFTGRAIIEETDDAERIALIADVRTGTPADPRCQRAIVDATSDLLWRIRETAERSKKALATVRGIRTERDYKTGAVGAPFPEGFPHK